MVTDINQIIAGLERDAAGYLEIKCVNKTFFVAAGPGRGSSPKDLVGPYDELEVALPRDRDYLAAFEEIYEPVRGMTDRDSLHALNVPKELIINMIEYYGGLVAS